MTHELSSTVVLAKIAVESDSSAAGVVTVLFEALLEGGNAAFVERCQSVNIGVAGDEVLLSVAVNTLREVGAGTLDSAAGWESVCSFGHWAGVDGHVCAQGGEEDRNKAEN